MRTGSGVCTDVGGIGTGDMVRNHRSVTVRRDQPGYYLVSPGKQP